jgi:hypothetical protein
MFANQNLLYSVFGIKQNSKNSIVKGYNHFDNFYIIGNQRITPPPHASTAPCAFMHCFLLFYARHRIEPEWFTSL